MWMETLIVLVGKNGKKVVSRGRFG